jgi:hypothetical protein
MRDLLHNDQGSHEEGCQAETHDESPNEENWYERGCCSAENQLTSIAITAIHSRYTADNGPSEDSVPVN